MVTGCLSCVSMNERYLTISAYAKLAKTSRQTIYKRITDGDIKPVEGVAGVVLIDLQAYPTKDFKTHAGKRTDLGKK